MALNRIALPAHSSACARVIVVSSSLGTYSSSGSITYGASKAALTSWGRALP